MEQAYLVLADGQVFEGFRMGAEGDAVGQLVFTTGTGGYLETLTDPCYEGQIVLQTFPLMGNYGVIREDFESGRGPLGYVVRELCREPSNFRSQGELDTYLKERGIAGICGVDTRQLTRVLREQGGMNAVICDRVPSDLTAVRRYAVADAVERVSHPTEVIPAWGGRKYRLALVDCGVRRSTVWALTERGCEVTLVHCDASAEAILSLRPDGVVLSDGPGDPAVNAGRIEMARTLMGKVPVLGIGLGHQLMALAQGGRTEQLPCGHRGGNQPVKTADGKRTYVTSQNHGYTVLPQGIRSGAVSFLNADDLTCEGMDYPALLAFSVQFRPEGACASGNTAFLFDRFVTLMGGAK